MPSDGWVSATATASGHVEPSTVKKQHQRALKLSGVRPFVLYALRHTFLTRLGEAGCDAWTLAPIAGHSSIAMSARYVHPSQDAVIKLPFHVLKYQNNFHLLSNGSKCMPISG
jgi:integrase